MPVRNAFYPQKLSLVSNCSEPLAFKACRAGRVKGNRGASEARPAGNEPIMPEPCGARRVKD